MPIAPFSPGILPSGAAFAPMPPLPAPIKSAPATSTLAVNANGSLVSFLPPVNDWYSPALQTPATQMPAQQTTPDHPCQSGGDCGCGGNCKKGASQTPKSNANNAAPGTYLSYKFPTGKSGVIQELRLSLPTFSRIEMSMDMPGQSEPVTAALNLTPGVGWKYDTGGKAAAFGAIVVPPIIPESATPSDIATGFLVGNMIVSKSIDTLQKASLSASVASSRTSSVPPPAPPSPIPPPGTNCPQEFGKNISADENLICDYFAHQTLSIQYPCGNFITLDVQSCCIQHDINLWCGPPNIITDSGELLAWLALVETELAGCVAGMILGTIGDSGVSWWCGGYITAAIYAAVAAALVFTLWYSLTYAFQLGQIANDIFTTGGSSAFPLDGRNKDRCLCGGTTPTYATGVAGLGTCYDFCAQRGLKEDCYKCGWTCDYSSGIGTYQFDDGSDPTTNPNGWCCCPCTSQADNPVSPQTPCPTCYDCYWYCVGNSLEIKTDPSGNNLPCCNAIGQIRSRRGEITDPYPPVPSDLPCGGGPQVGEHRS